MLFNFLVFWKIGSETNECSDAKYWKQNDIRMEKIYSRQFIHRTTYYVDKGIIFVSKQYQQHTCRILLLPYKRIDNENNLLPSWCNVNNNITRWTLSIWCTENQEFGCKAKRRLSERGGERVKEKLISRRCYFLFFFSFTLPFYMMIC
jgi:hypothetical protein